MRVGIIGMGFMGGVHLRNWQKQSGADVAAVCNTSAIQAKQGNIDSGGEELDLAGVAIYTEISEMLASENLDAVSITLPTHLHKATSIQCLEAGVHVLCEKPMALSLEDCDEMIASAKAANKELMIAHCIRFWPQYAWLKNACDQGEYGAVLAANFSRLTYPPGWDKGGWFSDQSKSGGIALDLHIHDLDFIQYLLGTPEKVESHSIPFDSGVIGHVETRLQYGDSQSISAVASWMMPESFGFQMAFQVILEKAAIQFDDESLKVFPAEGDPFRPETPDEDGYLGQITYFSQLIAGGERNPSMTPEQARESVRIALNTKS
ncbi:Gfo/Idh/MocA family protein [Haloferula sp.]|uniref:Gfo/Idh/MocA family protein n=1 Tax=Haloferula sp. TaxID=2497595 RepID=UPI00329C0793